MLEARIAMGFAQQKKKIIILKERTHLPIAAQISRHAINKSENREATELDFTELVQLLYQISS